MVISVAPSYDAHRRLYRRARKIIGLLLCTFLPGFSCPIIYLRSDTRFREPIEFFPEEAQLSYYLSNSDIIARTDTANRNETDVCIQYHH